MATPYDEMLDALIKNAGLDPEQMVGVQTVREMFDGHVEAAFEAIEERIGEGDEDQISDDEIEDDDDSDLDDEDEDSDE